MVLGIKDCKQRLQANPQRWLVTGAAGFIGSHLVEKLLRLGQTVIALDNFATGSQSNIDCALSSQVKDSKGRFEFHQGDIADSELISKLCSKADIVLHQAALGSVPRSIKDPIATNQANVQGFLQMLVSAKEAGIKRVVYASSSSVYGDSEALPKVESSIGAPLSPYAVSKLTDELYARTFCESYGMELIGLRYFNVFGPRQDPQGPYAAVIPRWIDRIMSGQVVEIFGDGETSRDFCFVDNAVNANLLGAVADFTPECIALNVACGVRTTLNELYSMIAEALRGSLGESIQIPDPKYKDFRAGDVRHSLADISLAKRTIGYQPQEFLNSGIAETVAWFLKKSN